MAQHGAALAAGELVGRDVELQAVREALTGPAPIAVVLEGEAGIGKTALWRAGVAFAEEAGQRVVSAQPGEAETGLSHAALGDLLGPLADESAMSGLPAPQRRALEVALLRVAPGESPLDPHAVGAGTVALLRAGARERPLLVAVDDVQWLDSASAAALAFAMRRLGDAAVRLLATERLTHRAERADLGLRGEQAVRLSVKGLEPEALQRLVRGALDTALSWRMLRQIAEVSGGNPYYALELARAAARHGEGVTGELPLPDDLALVLRDRLETLPVATREALGAVAALGSATGADVARAVEPGDLDPGFAAGILHEEGEAIRFEHPLLAAAAYGMLTPARRRAVHERLSGLAVDAEERARHLAVAKTGPDAAAAAAIEAGAHAAAARGAPAAAAHLLQASARIEPDPEAAAARRLQAAYRLIAAGDGLGAVALGERLVEELPRGLMRARALLFLSDQEGPMEESLELSRQALEEAGDDLDVRIRVLLARAMALSIELRDQEAFDHALQAWDLCPPDAPRELRVQVMTRYGDVACEAGVETLDLLRSAADLEGDDLIPDAYWGPHTALGRMLMFADDLDGARPLMEERYERAAEAGDDEARAGLCLHLAELECRAGQFEAARRYAEAGLAIQEASYDDRAQASVVYVRALVAAYQGEVELSRSLGERGLAQAIDQSDRIFDVMNRGVLGFLELSLGDHAAAYGWLSGVPVKPAELRLPHSICYSDALEAFIGVGRHDEAERLIPVWEQARFCPPRAHATAARARALVAAARGELDAALAHLDEALEHHEGLPVPFERARTLVVLGTVQRRGRHKAAARAALEEALASFEAMGTPLWAERARAELGRIGGRAPSGGLTPTEQRVADLVAEGLSNKQVAEALFVSIRTVEANLTRVYAKLGVRSRTELASRRGR